MDSFVNPNRRFVQTREGIYSLAAKNTVIEFDLPERLIYKTDERTAYFGTEPAVFDEHCGYILHIDSNKHWLDASGNQIALFSAAELATAESDLRQVVNMAGIKTVVERR